MFLDQFLVVKNMTRKTRESLFMLLLVVCPVHMAYESCARVLYASCEMLMHVVCVILVHFSYTQDLPPDNSSLYLSTEMVEISMVEARVFSLD